MTFRLCGFCFLSPFPILQIILNDHESLLWQLNQSGSQQETNDMGKHGDSEEDQVIWHLKIWQLWHSVSNPRHTANCFPVVTYVPFTHILLDRGSHVATSTGEGWCVSGPRDKTNGVSTNSAIGAPIRAKGSVWQECQATWEREAVAGQNPWKPSP